MHIPINTILPYKEPAVIDNFKRDNMHRGRNDLFQIIGYSYH